MFHFTDNLFIYTDIFFFIIVWGSDLISGVLKIFFCINKQFTQNYV